MLRLPLALLLVALFLSRVDAQVSTEQDRDVAPSVEDRSVAYPAQEEELEWWQEVLFWIPFRVVDFIDIFRADVGVGSSVGGVIRATPHGQIGYRTMFPASLRGGLFGRRSPFLVETSDEFGVGQDYTFSQDREVCPGEVGLGADLFLGVYLGVCFDEVGDFLAGFVLMDPKGDDDL